MALRCLTANRGQGFFSKLYLKNRYARLSCRGDNHIARRNFSMNTFSLENVTTTSSEINLIKPTKNEIQILGLGVARMIPSSLSEIWNGLSTWLIKRTFQPSIIRKRRKTGFLKRQKSVGGRRVLQRRRNKGRKRLGGC